ncbi:FHA domain-containing protein [Psychrobacter sp. H7-1]|uniref:FHA domain-containing protein n=1 Tax=Psychrobacter sp. H7-1 TaxID=1569265 RepID=UPI0019196576|nr:FHA domain-containing protein [Psychrobacter sp. H7-1]
MSDYNNTNQTQWQLTALTEALGNLELNVDHKLTVGRGQDNDVVLGSKQVSRQHAELTVVDDELLVQDLGSSNGTLVNDVRLEPHQPKSLVVDDVVTFAAFSFQVKQTQPVDSAAVSAPEPEVGTIEPEVETVEPEVIEPEVETVEPEAIEPEIETIEPETVEPIETAEIVEAPATHSVEPLAEPITPTAQPEKTGSEFDKFEAAERAEHQAEENAEAIEKSGIKNMTEAELEQKLEEELEQPTGVYNSEQNHLHKDDAEHFAELAREADPEVHKSKQAAAAQMSATTNLHDTVEPDAKKPVKELTGDAENEINTQTQAPVSEKNPANSFNTVNEQPQHKVAHIHKTDSAPQNANSGSNKGFLWMALILLVLAVALWLYNSGTLA